MAKFEGKDGRWITTKTGKHIFIEAGKTVEEAMGEAFEEFQYDPDDDFDQDFDFDDEDDGGGIEIDWDKDDWTPEKRQYKKYETPEPADENKAKLFKALKGKLKFGKDDRRWNIKGHFLSQINSHEVQDEDLYNIVTNQIATNNDIIQKIRIRSEYKKGGTFYNRYKKGIFMAVSEGDDYMQTMSNLFHEAGHAIDNDGTGKYYSSTYISKIHGVTLQEMLKDEISEIDINKVKGRCEELEDLRDKVKALYNDGKIDYNTRVNERARLQSARLSIIDVIQGTHGAKYAMDNLGTFTHAGYYFDDKYDWLGPVNRGTEFFAEMTDDLINDKERNFSQFMREIAPKSTEIYFEILKEKYGYGRTK